MARVTAEIEGCLVENESGRDVPGLSAKCSRCEHEVCVYGTASASEKRAMMMLREECPNDEENWYTPDDDGGESRMPDPVVKPWWQKK